MKISEPTDETVVQVTIIVDTKKWAEEYAVDLAEVPADFQSWVVDNLREGYHGQHGLIKKVATSSDRKDPPPFDLMVTLTGDAVTTLQYATSPEGGVLHTLRLAVEDGTFKIKENEDMWSAPLTDGVLIQKGHEIP